MQFSKIHGSILLGTNNGRIIIYNWPLFEETKGKNLNGCYEICVDNAAITEIKFSTDSKTVFISTDSGNIFCCSCLHI